MNGTTDTLRPRPPDNDIGALSHRQQATISFFTTTRTESSWERLRISLLPRERMTRLILRLPEPTRGQTKFETTRNQYHCGESRLPGTSCQSSGNSFWTIDLLAGCGSRKPAALW